MAAINNMIRKYGTMDEIFGQEQYAQIPMAVVGIVMKFFQIVISVVVGMAAGCIPIAGFNTGAGFKNRVLHGICRKVIPYLPVHDCICLHQQGCIYLFTGDGKGHGFHNALHDT